MSKTQSTDINPGDVGNICRTLDWIDDGFENNILLVAGCICPGLRFLCKDQISLEGCCFTSNHRKKRLTLFCIVRYPI
uniref:Uncharacterized protein n=1 Tax=Strigamia maritima TaxID=126957 RepID=T1IND0_STRMM